MQISKKYDTIYMSLFFYMFNTISKKFATSWSLTKTAFFYMSRDAELFWYSFLSVMITFTALGIIVIILVAAGFFNISSVHDWNESTWERVLVVIGFTFYLISGFIAYFFRAAIATSVERRLAGQDNTFMDGIRSAFSRIGKIFLWALVESTVFFLIDRVYNLLKNRPFIGRIIRSILTTAWNIMTYFSFILMVLTNR